MPAQECVGMNCCSQSRVIDSSEHSHCWFSYCMHTYCIIQLFSSSAILINSGDSQQVWLSVFF